MKALFTFVITSIISTISFAQAAPIAGFKNGNELEVQTLRGSVQYYCRDNMGKNYTRHWSCVADLVSPDTHDYVIANAKIDANKVTITATHEDGSTKSKTVNFNSEKSVSSSRVNLWVKTLTQSPLLEKGANSINVEFKKSNKVVESGNFVSQVHHLGAVQCRHRATYAQNNGQCDNQNMGCDYYFYLENNCQY